MFRNRAQTTTETALAMVAQFCGINSLPLEGKQSPSEVVYESFNM